MCVADGAHDDIVGHDHVREEPSAGLFEYFDWARSNDPEQEPGAVQRLCDDGRFRIEPVVAATNVEVVVALEAAVDEVIAVLGVRERAIQIKDDYFGLAQNYASRMDRIALNARVLIEHGA